MSALTRDEDLQAELTAATRTFRQYRDGAYITYPGVVEVEKFEQDLLTFLANRRSGQYAGDESPSTMYGTSLSWMALLFALFASGAQFSPIMQKTQRDLISGVYGESGVRLVVTFINLCVQLAVLLSAFVSSII